MRKKNRSSVRSNILTFLLNGNCVFIQTIFLDSWERKRERSERKKEKREKKGREKVCINRFPNQSTMLVYANCIQITPGSNAG